ncbi:Guanine nucleotide-binding protein subunit beta-2-like 1 [Hondaea fermentalgiana]|uniref:Guanine nucleotide-binding protein subunit beta-2-like 1 n=1 Tax=Hondaea fermentalgiana TaxID=2315210 RepID=A0A2R5GB96_9STRA|nr:Guanine nucleotide-binding protein subunit beta-2-like 1 [Hondaea fermentalgiana]|eukprot:GBG26978.1 Guanine nucleotide-binding protein subunit beta-2-like 1 [Hondaea fermentalgiana]
MRIATPEASSDLTPLMRDIYIRLNPWSSEAWAKGKVKKITIGTRNWILDELYDWYDCAKSAVFVLVGDGGVGKSVVMAELCRCGGALHIDEDAELSETDGSTDSRRNSSHGHGPSHRSKRKQLPIHVAAYHFFRHDQATAAAPKEAIVSIAWQLCQTVPGFSNKLNSVRLSNIRDKPLADVFQLILVNPADKLRSDQMRQVVVLDALDECSKSDNVMEKVIRMWKDVMPAWLSLVVSTRPEGEIQRGITNNSLDSKVLQLKAEDNFRDIENHIRRMLRDMKGITEQKDVASCAKILSERSGGLFLWTSFLPKTLARMHEEKKCGLLTIHDISMKDVIPSGLGGMFKGYFDRLKVKMGGDEAYQLLLAPIVAAREPLSVDQLTVILGLTKKKTKKIVDNARNLLYQGGDGRLALIHKRMADWLLDDDLSGDLGVDIEAGHEALAKYCRLRDDVFSLRHAIFHLVKSCNQTNRAEAFNLLNDFAWVRKVISVGDDEAQRRVTIGNLIRDCVKVGIYIAPESDTPRFLSKAVHALSYDPNELASQVMARLGFNPKDSLALQAPDQPWLKPSRVTLTHPCDPLLHVLKGHSRWVMSVAIQGERVVSGSKDGTVRTWNATSGEEQHVFRGHSDSVLSVAIRDNRIVSGSSDETVRIWDATSGEQRLLKGHSWPVTSVAIEGDIIVSGSDDKTVRIWSAASVKEQHVLKGHSQAVSSVAISSDAVVSGSHDNTIRIWNATSGEMQSVLEGHSDWVVSVAIEGNTIVSGSSDGTVRIWDTTSDEERHVLKEGSSKVTSVAIEGNTIVFGTVDRTVCIWDTTSGKKPYVSKGHSGEITSVGIEGDTIVSGSWDHTVRILNATSGEEHHALNGHYDAVTSLAIEGDVIVSGSWDSTVRIWNATSGEERHVLKGHSFGVTSVTIKGDTVVSGSSDGMVRIWNATSGEEKHILKGHSTWVRSVAIEGEIVVSGSNDNTVRVWNATLGEEQCILKGHSDWVRSVAIRGGTIVSASYDRTVRTWNAASGKVQYVLKGHSGPVWSVAIEGDTIISLSLDGTRYWNARKGEECDANEAGASPTPRTNTFVNIENETHVRLDGGVGFTTDDNINCIVRQGNVYVVGDVMGMVHILHAQVRVNVS